MSGDNVRSGGIVRDMDLMFLAQAEPVATGKLLIDWTPILLSLFATINAIGVPLIAYLVIKSNANSRKAAEIAAKLDEKTDKMEEKADKAAETLKEVKVDVNSGKSKMEEKMVSLEDKLLVLTAGKATADEKIRSEQDKAVALAASKVAPTTEAKEP